MMEQFAEERSMKATLLLLPGTKWLVPGTGERSLKANACGVSERSLRGFHQTICKLAIFSLPFSFSSFFHAIKKWTDRILGFKCRKKSYFIARISGINIFQKSNFFPILSESKSNLFCQKNSLFPFSSDPSTLLNRSITRSDKIVGSSIATNIYSQPRIPR